MLTKLVLAEGSRDLIIAFSGRGVPAGRFQPYKQLVAVGTNVLFFNCSHDDWYQSEMDAIREEIARVVAEMQPERVLYYGFSMGAHPALILGSQHEGARVLALSGETEVGLWAMLSTHLTPGGPYGSVEPFVRSARCASIQTVYGEFSMYESEYATRMRAMGAAVQYLPCAHATSSWLHEMGCLQETVRSALEGEVFNYPRRREHAFMYPLHVHLHDRGPFEWPSDWETMGRDNWVWLDLLAAWHTMRTGDLVRAAAALRQARRAVKAMSLCDPIHNAKEAAAHLAWRRGELHRHILADRAAHRAGAGQCAAVVAAVEDGFHDPRAARLDVVVAGGVGDRSGRRDQDVVGRPAVPLVNAPARIAV